MNKYSLMLVALLATVIASCSDSNSGSSDDTDTGDQNPMPSPMAMPAANFDGDFFRSCTLEADDENPTTTSINIQGDIWQSSVIEYLDAACTMPLDVFDSTLLVTFPGGTTETALGTAQHIDITVQTTIVNGQEIELPPEFNTEFFSIALLDEPNLFLGDDDDDSVATGLTPETRESELDPVPAVRQ